MSCDDCRSWKDRWVNKQCKPRGSQTDKRQMESVMDKVMWMIINDRTWEKEKYLFIYLFFLWHKQNFRVCKIYLTELALWTDGRSDWQGDGTAHSGASKWQYFNVTLGSKGHHRRRRKLTAISWKDSHKVKSYTYNRLSPTHREERKMSEGGRKTFFKGLWPIYCLWLACVIPPG